MYPLMVNQTVGKFLRRRQVCKIIHMASGVCWCHSFDINLQLGQCKECWMFEFNMQKVMHQQEETVAITFVRGRRISPCKKNSHLVVICLFANKRLLCRHGDGCRMSWRRFCGSQMTGIVRSWECCLGLYEKSVPERQCPDREIVKVQLCPALSYGRHLWEIDKPSAAITVNRAYRNGIGRVSIRNRRSLYVSGFQNGLWNRLIRFKGKFLTRAKWARKSWREE